MKIYGIFIVKLDPPTTTIICSETDLSSFGYFQRGSVAEFMTFIAKTLAERTPQVGQRQTVEQQDYLVHVHTRRADLSGVIVADREYPSRVAFALLQKAFDEFLQKYPPKSSSSAASSTGTAAVEWKEGMELPFLKDAIVKYQNPHEADGLMKIQKELDETKIIMHKTIESVLRRGENLDTLAAKSNDLSTASKMFLQTAKSNNSCCQIM